MNYSDLRELIEQKTIKLLEIEKWDEILQIFQKCPEQIYFFKLILEEKLKSSKALDEFPVVKIIYENNSQDDPSAPLVYYKFTNIFNLIFEVLNYKSDFFSQEFREQLCKILYPKITDFLENKRYRISSIDKFIKNLYAEIQQYYHKDIVNHLFLLKYLNKEKPEDLIEFFPEIISKRLYQLGYELIIKFNELIKQYDSETKEILANIIIYEKQYYSLKELLEEENKELIDIMEINRERLKKEFYMKFINFTKKTLDLESFERNPEDTFRYTIDLYSEEELEEIIIKIIELKITHSHYGERTKNNWVHLLLLDIAWAKQSHLFKDYLDDLAQLGHLQVVQTYFRHFPEKIKKFQDFIFDYLDSFTLDLLRLHFEAFEIKNPIKIFKRLLFKNIPADNLALIFFSQLPELINSFKDVIKEYINIILKEDKSNRGLYYKLDGLLKIYYRAYPEYTHKPDSNINLMEIVYSYVISKNLFKKEDCFIYNLRLAKNFNQLDNQLQDDLISQLVETKNLSSIEYLLNFGYIHLKRYIDLILTFDPKHELQSEHFIKVLEIILRENGNNKKIQELVKNRIKDQVLCNKKAEIYSFLGEFNLSKQVIKQVLNKEANIPYAINSYIDYKLVKIEFSINNASQIDISQNLDELNDIEYDFEKFNRNQSLLQNFKFKFNSYKARINFYDGFTYLEDKIYQRSKSAFQDASKIYYELRKAKIKPDTKKIFDVFWKVSHFFSLNLIDISNFSNSEELNSFIKKKLIDPLLEQHHINLQMKRFLENVSLLKFNSDMKISSQLACEIPTKFCPIPPRILKRRLLDNNRKTIIEWNEGNKKVHTQEPILLMGTWQVFYFILEFEEKGKVFDFNPSYTAISGIHFRFEDVKKQAGINCYKFLIRSPLSFMGEQSIKILFTENNICGFTLSQSFTIIHYDIQSLEDQIIDEITLKIRKYKGDIYKPLKFKLFLKQFKDSEIRFSFLKNILLRVKDYYYTFNNMTQAIVKEIEHLPFNEKDELIFVVLNQLSTKSPIFWEYFTNHYLNLTSHKIEIKKSNKIPKYLSKYTKQNRLFLIFLDDVIGTGEQFLKFYKNDFENQYKKFTIQDDNRFKFYLVAGIGSEQSIDKISKKTLIPECHIRYSRVIRPYERAFNPDNWDNIDDLIKVKEYLKQIHPIRWGGYRKNITEEGLEYLVVLEWNTPNNTLGCLYKKNNKWRNPLFPRTKG